MERRDFLRTTCSACIAIGAGIAALDLASCGSSAVYESAIIEKSVSVPLSLFAHSPIQIVRPKGYGFDVAVKREPDGTFAAMVMRCTHASNELDFSGNSFTCSLHGSKFDTEGNVTRGPASRPLQRLTATVNATDVSISLV